MATIAQWLIGGGFTATEKNFAVRRRFKAHRRKPGVFDLDGIGGVRCALGFIHNQVPFAVYYCVVGALII